jgi:hypothetical protein
MAYTPADEKFPQSGYINSTTAGVTENGIIGFMQTTYGEYCLDDSEPCSADQIVEYYPGRLLYLDTVANPGEEATATAISMEDGAYNYQPSVIGAGNALWVTECRFARYDENNRKILHCFAKAWDFSDPANPVLKENLNIPGQLIGVSKDGERLYTVNTVYEPGEDGGYGAWISYYYILRRSAEPDKLEIVKKLKGGGSYYEQDETSRTYTRLSAFVQNDILYGIEMKYISYLDPECSYWYYQSQKYTAVVKAYSANDGELLFEKEIEGGYQVDNVGGDGGIIISKPSRADYFTYYGQRKLVYISPAGEITEAQPPEASSYSEYCSSYYATSSDGRAVRLGDTVYYPRCWEDIFQFTVN